MIDRDNRTYARLDRDRVPERYCSGGGGSSSSSSSSTQESYSYDMRIAAGNNSQNISAQNSTITVLDQGAIRESFSFAKNAIDKSMQGVNDALSEVRDAYSEAKAGEQKVLVAGGLMILGVVALQAVKRG